VGGIQRSVSPLHFKAQQHAKKIRKAKAENRSQRYPRDPQLKPNGKRFPDAARNDDDEANAEPQHPIRDQDS
jgi:hypothetical protein